MPPIRRKARRRPDEHASAWLHARSCRRAALEQGNEPELRCPECGGALDEATGELAGLARCRRCGEWIILAARKTVRQHAQRAVRCMPANDR